MNMINKIDRIFEAIADSELEESEVERFEKKDWVNFIKDQDWDLDEETIDSLAEYMLEQSMEK